jgi:hypothetical protein
MSKISDKIEEMGARADNIPQSVIELLEFLEARIEVLEAKIPTPAPTTPPATPAQT